MQSFDISLDEHFGVLLKNLEMSLGRCSSVNPEIIFTTRVFQNPDHDGSDYEDDYARFEREAEVFVEVGHFLVVSLELNSDYEKCWFRFDCQIKDVNRGDIVEYEGQEDARLEEGEEEEEVIVGSDTLDTPPGHINFMVPLPIEGADRKRVLRATIADFADGENVKLFAGHDDLGLYLIPAIFAEEYSRDRQILFTDDLSLSFSREFDLSSGGIQKFKREMPTAFRYICAAECMTVLGEDSERSQLISVSVE
jgi:hypothetical protein